MRTRTLFRAALAAAAAGAGVTAASDASACGGLFCNGVTPVVQTGEGIVFTVDHQANVVEAVINIRYQGAANEFAWVLPLQSAPDTIDVGPSQMFVVADQLTAPRFQLSFERRGICADELQFSEDNSAGIARTSEPEPGVTVLSRDAVGPYDTVVLESEDPAQVRRWLEDNSYAVTDEMMAAVVPYIAKGDVLLALKLRKDRDTGDIQPIYLRMAGVEACVPIRMTAIAAQADMEITAIVLSNSGRAIPDNFYHVELNLARIDWMSGGANYRQVVADAADEGDGNAFTTEYSGPTSIFAGRIDVQGRIDRASLEAVTTQGAFLNAVGNLAGTAELAGLFARYLDARVMAAQNLTPLGLASCPRCSAQLFEGLPIDGPRVAEDVWATIVRPSETAQSMFDRFSHMTRLYTLISPEEMNVDPIFSFKAGLPDVSNVHTARAIFDCGLGGSGNNAVVSIIIDETGQEIALDSAVPGETNRTLLDQMPGASNVRQLRDDTLVKDNAARIAEMLADHNAGVGLGCGCGSARFGRRAPAYYLAAVVLLGLSLRVLGKRRR